MTAARRKAPNPAGFLGELRRDSRGNTLAMAAIALIPLSAMIGSGVDMSRTYLVKARLQSACDAGALAARKVMDGSATMTAASTTAGINFFNNNFPAGTYGATNVAYSQSLDSEKQVVGSATARVPMTLMKMFNYEYRDVDVTCSARLDITNTDVMFVLDVTGSMADCPDDSNCASNSSSKIAGLRSAVVDFYNTLSGAAPSTAQIRYGFVPYSQGVRLSDVIGTGRILDTWTYQSRVANMNTPTYLGVYGTPSSTFETYPSAISNSECTSYGNNKSWPSSNDGATWWSGSAPAATTRTFYSKEDWVKTGTRGSGASLTDIGTCRREKEVTPVTYTTKYAFTNWNYKPVSYDTSSFQAGNAISYASGSPGTGTSNNYLVDTAGEYKITDLPTNAGTRGTSWNATIGAYMGATAQSYNGSISSSTFDKCVEERDTVANTTFTYGSIPAAAYDLDIDTPATNAATTWRPSWPALVYRTDGGRPGYACPYAAQKLQTMTATDVQNYVNNLAATGSTWHDLGMTWGARLISPTGMFASENTTAPNGQSISRNIIFMTDGLMNADENAYGGWGYEILDKRTSGGDFATMDSRHNSRFIAMCNAARAKNIRIWTIGFGQTIPTNLTQCADPGQAFSASNTATLRQQFTAIATKIAKLRLAQ